MPENLRAIRRKIKTVQSIGKITRAMKMVAAAKLRRAQGQVDAGRVYWDALAQLIGHVADCAEELSHPFLQPGPGETDAVLVIGGSRGLCGSYNVSLLRHALQSVSSLKPRPRLMTVGPKAQQFLSKRGWAIEKAFGVPEESERLQMATDVAAGLRELFLSGQVGTIHVVFTEFYSAIRHRPLTRQLLPVQAAEMHDKNGGGIGDYIFEPAAEQLLGGLLPRAVDAAVYRMLLESAAAEEGARMAAMTAATDNADEMTTTLKRDLNRARQSQITTELLEVVSGAEALESG